jgi:CSLREA domain-containing protein
MNAMNWRRVVGLGIVFLLSLITPVHTSVSYAETAVALVVNKTADTDDGVCDTDCSLREAISVGNDSAEADHITFDLPIDSTIVLSGTSLSVTTGHLTIDGSTADGLVVSGNTTSRVFEIEAGTVVTISQLTVQDGFVQPAVGDAIAGGILNQGDLRLWQVQVMSNQARGADSGLPGGEGADAYGGGIYNGCTEANCGILAVYQSILVANGAYGGRGGDGSGKIFGGDGGIGYAGGLYNDCLGALCGSVLLEDTLFLSNRAIGGYGGNHEGQWEYTGGDGGWGYAGGIFNRCGQLACGSIVMTRVAIKSSSAVGGKAGLPCARDGETRAGGIYNLGTISGTQVDISYNYLGWSELNCEPYSGHSGWGGGVYQAGAMHLTDSVIYNNQSFRGGGLYLLPDTFTDISNSTISGNEGLNGGGIYAASAALVLEYVTIANNQAGTTDFRYLGYGGGIYVNGGAVTIKSTILANNKALHTSIDPDRGDDCYGSFVSLGYNLITDTESCSLKGDQTGNILNQPAMINPLRDNGGPTLSHALWPFSPALDGGHPADCPETDQRGESRPQDGDGNGTTVCDIGAYEGFAPADNRVYLPVTVTP